MLRRVRTGRWVAVTAETSNSVSLIDQARNKVVDNLLVDLRPRAAAFSPDGKKLYVTAEIGGTLSVIDAKTHVLLKTIPIARGEGKPVGVAISSDGQRVYVAGGWSGTLSVIDGAKDVIVAEIPVGKRPWGVAISKDGERAYTANGMSNDIAVVDTKTQRVLMHIPVGTRPWGVVLTTGFGHGE